MTQCSIRPEKGRARLRRGEVWRLVAPWLGYIFLAAAGVLGLFTASAAPDDATYDAGLALFILAVLLIAMRLKRQFDGREIGFLLPVPVDGTDSLFVSIAVLAVLGLVGVILAATVGGTSLRHRAGALRRGTALIFTEIKRYFDRRDRGG